MYNAIGFYTFFIFMVSYLRHYTHFSLASIYTINTLSILVLMGFMPISGMLSDRFSPKTVIITMAILMAILLYPLFYLLTLNQLWLVVIAILCIAIVFGLTQGSLPGVFANLFPMEVRASGLSISFNISNAIFGGTAPYFATWIIGHTGSYHGLLNYIILAAILFVVTAIYLSRDLLNGAGSA